MKRLLVIFFCIDMTSCFWWKAEEKYYLADDLWLYWWGGEDYSCLIYSFPEERPGKMYSIIVPSVIFAAGSNEDFIILKRHPNRVREVRDRVFGKSDTQGWLLADPADSIYLTPRGGAEVYQVEGVWYHNSGGWTPPDSIRNPYRRITEYYILDLKPVRADTARFRPGTQIWMEELQRHIHKYDSQADFTAGRKALNVPDSLDFTIKIDRME